MNGTETDTPHTVARRLRSTPANGGTEKVSRKGDEQFMTIMEWAVVQRIRRKLRNTTHVLRKARGERQQVDCGRYYVIDANLNALLCSTVS
jgi:hypothetical protein